MKILRTWLMASVLGVLLLGIGTIVVQPAPASATLPPGWVPGTIYKNIYNLGINMLPPVPGTNQPVFSTTQYVPSTVNVGVSLPVTIGATYTVSTSITGQYCSDTSGGLVWVQDGAPTDGLTCPAQSSS